MKREALDHTKMKRLCRRLDIPRYQGVGILESLWQLTGKEAPRGDIGKLSNEDIALGIDYRGDEDKLVDALAHSGWLDVVDGFRLVIHDWPEHADDTIHRRLARAKQFFWNGEPPRLGRLTGKEKEQLQQFYDLGVENSTTGARFDDPGAQNDTSGAPPHPAPPHPAPPLTNERNEKVEVLSLVPELVRPSSSDPIEIPKKPMSPPASTTGTQTLTPKRISDMRDHLQAYMTPEGRRSPPPPPDDGIVLKCLNAVGNAPMDEVHRFLRQLRNERDQGPGRANGPKTYAWFPTVLQAHFRDGPGGVLVEQKPENLSEARI